MTQHLPISCPKCSLDLSVRVENLGRKGICKHCGHVFRAQLTDILELLPILVGHPGQVSEGEGAGHAPQDQARELEQIRTLLAAQPSGYASALQRIDDVEGRTVQFHGPRPEHRGPTALAGGAGREPAASTKVWEAGGSTPPGGDTGGDRPGSQGVRANDREIAVLRNERNRLWGEAQDARARIDALSAETSAELSRLTAERDSARAEAERSGTDRDSLAREVDRLRDEVQVLERSRVEVEAEHDHARRLGEQQRSELVAEAEREIGLLKEQYETEHRARLADREEHAKAAEERGKFAREVGQLRDRLEEAEGARSRAEAELGVAVGRREDERRELEARWERERRELLGEAEIKAGRNLLAERERSGAEREALSRQLEQLRTEADAELADVYARWERERSDLEAQWGQQRQSLLDDAGRRLREQRELFDAEREAWRSRSEEHEQAGAERDRLATEAEEARDRLGAERDALVQELGHLRDRLAGSERSRAAVETELGDALDRWEDEREALEERWEQERQNLTARLQAGSRHLEEIDRLVDERDGLKLEADRLRSRLEEVERLGAEGDASPGEAGESWEEQRRELEGKWLQRFEEMRALTEQKLSEQREAFEAERRSRGQQSEADRPSPRKETEALRDRLAAAQRERDGSLRDASAIGLERDRLHARLGEVEAALRRSEQSRQADRDRAAAALEQARLESVAAARVVAERAEEVRAQRAELEQQRREHEDLGRQYQRKLESARREWAVERQRWLDLTDAARPFALGNGPGQGPHPPGVAGGPPPAAADPAAAGGEDAPEGGGLSATRVGTPGVGRKRRVRRTGADLAVTARPQAGSYEDPRSFRSDLERWQAGAEAKLQEIATNPDRPGNETMTNWLRYEIETAQAEISLLPADPPPRQPAPDEVPESVRREN